jgi:hypothetical protein
MSPYTVVILETVEHPDVALALSGVMAGISALRTEVKPSIS